jgi:hypothetical protein
MCESRGSSKPGWEYGLLGISATMAIYFVSLGAGGFGLLSNGVANIFDIKVGIFGVGMVPAFFLLAKFRHKINATQLLPTLPHDNWPLSLLYVSIASAGFVTALSASFPQPTAGSNQSFQIPADHLLLFLSFLATAIPFYHGALTYMQRTASDVGRRTMFDFLVLLFEAFVILVLSVSSSSPLAFVTWLFILLAVDTLWMLVSLHDGRKDPPPAVWLYLNVSMLLCLATGALLGVVQDDAIFLSVLAFVTVGRSIVDYLVAWPVYFPLRKP